MIFIIPILIILDALKDALYDSGKKHASGLIDMVFLSAMICGVVLLKDDWTWIAVYVLLRYSLFDLIYNITRRLPLLYVGVTKPYDRLIRKIFNENAIHFLFITKLMALMSAVAIIIR